MDFAPPFPAGLREHLPPEIFLQRLDLVVDLPLGRHRLSNLIPEQPVENISTPMQVVGDVYLAYPQLSRHLAVTRVLRPPRAVQKQPERLVILRLPSLAFLLHPLQRALDQGHCPSPVKHVLRRLPGRKFGEGHLLRSVVPDGEVEAARLLSATASDLLREETVHGDEDEGAETATVAVDGGDEVLFEEGGEVFLGDVQSVVVAEASAADVVIPDYSPAA